jgi:putative phosphoesterase
MLVAIVSDTHGVLDPRIAAEVSRCDYAVHGGDIGSAAVLEALRPRTRTVVAVLGNNDVPEKWPVGEAPVLAGLPFEASLQLPGGLLVVVHGHQHPGPLAARHAWLRRRYPQARVIVYGHSHRRVLDDTEAPWVLNPGAAGRARTYGGPSLAILEARADAWLIEERRFDLGT